jgi:hypothetical protein
MLDAIFIVLVLAALFGGLLMLHNFSVKQAIPQVLRILRQKNAISIDSAKTLDELGIKYQYSAQSAIQGMWKRRDYKPDAMRSLIKAQVVLVTEDRKVYLSEEKLAASKWNRLKPGDRL